MVRSRLGQDGFLSVPWFTFLGRMRQAIPSSILTKMAASRKPGLARSAIARPAPSLKLDDTNKIYVYGNGFLKPLLQKTGVTFCWTALPREKHIGSRLCNRGNLCHSQMRVTFQKQKYLQCHIKAYCRKHTSRHKRIQSITKHQFWHAQIKM